ncbi:MAG TPA: phospholipase D-like domain-containing protein, partial [Candidatus Baltobacteraceae bacterium]
AVCDRVAYLDDCNWNSADTVIRDDNPAHVRAIRRAVLGGGPARAGSLALRKDVALKGEAKVIAHAAREADVETETLGASVVSGALRRLAKAGVHCRLLVSQWCADDDLGRKRIASLEKDGVQVRAVKSGEKLAVAGNRAWAGSANATSSFKKCNYIDWGLSTRDPRIVRDLHARFTEHWNEATPVEP